ncbi:hypothetical protein [Clostridium beijerinckii]|uniref:hypothetical protein n=1 Tax=Clostridium beijerinckii TaxID=1520 RepID=UPI000A3E92D3|nr:hypothetical protein [Clostridium beijerinckii]
MKKHCDKEECKNYWSCKVLKDRFKVKECDPNRIFIVNARYTREFINRAVLLKGLSE